MKPFHTRIYTLFPLFAGIFLMISPLPAQQNAEEIYKDIKKLGVLANVLYLAAHPDDENTRMISYFANHLYANTTYLSMTRGDGGQNRIGPEFREMLGIIRSHELLEARNIDGGHQLFTRANDFGYSKTPDETFHIWNKEEVLSDVVWAIRNTHPDVIINRFSTDTSRPNHGQHTASAMLSNEAFDLAGDPKSFPDQLKYVQPWQPHREFFNTFWWFFGSKEAFDKVDKSQMVKLDLGAYDPLTGESNTEIAGRSRSMHRSQGFGSAETRGESLEYLQLLHDVDDKIPASVFDGIDISWNRVPGGKSIAAKVSNLETTYDFKSPKASIPQLLDIYQSILALPASYWKTIKLKECKQLIESCLGLFMDARTNLYTVSPGMLLPVSVEIINRCDADVRLQKIMPVGMDTVIRDSTQLLNNIGITRDFKYRVPDHLSIPYWLEENPTTGMYVVKNQLLRGLPDDEPAFNVMIEVAVQGKTITFTVPVKYKTVDPAKGEVVRPVYITPPVTVEVDAEALMFNVGAPRVIPLQLKSYTDHVTGSLSLAIDQPGWKIEPETVDFSFSNAGQSRFIQSTITPPALATHATLNPTIHIGDASYHHKVKVIDYEHLPYMSIVRDAAIPLQCLDIKISHRTIAYIQGAGDDVPEALRQIGYQVDVIDPESITPELLSHYQVVMLGVRAFNTVDALKLKNAPLFDWVKNGGTMIVQYNVSSGLVTQDIAPYPLTLSWDRVTEENAPVTLLAPEHPVFQVPNKIEAADFDGWVQERGLYFPNSWDEHFTPLLEMHDTNENPMKGSLLVAPYGEGYYVYSGLSWFRHLPAGNPGPYRLLSNIISLGYKNNKS